MGESLREKVASLSRRELGALLAVAAVVVVGAALWYVRSLPRPVEVREATAPLVGPTVASPSPAVVIVHVAGEVRKPGVYSFQEGDRVIDAVNAAGGPRKKANLDALNLAAPLTDGEQVLVPASAPPGAAVPVASGAAAVPGASAPGALINVNTASETELETLTGIGPALAQAIIDYRTQNGPFVSVDSLIDVSGIGPATLEEFRSMVTV